MKLLVARDAAMAPVMRVVADQRPDRSISGVFAVFETGSPEARLLGVVTPHELAINPGHIFADLLPRKAQVPILADTELEASLAKMDDAQASALPVVDAEGGFIGAVTRESLWSCMLTQDRALTAEVETLRTKLAIADRMVAIGTLASGVAHEINNPLAYVMLNLDSLREMLSIALSPTDAAATAPLLEDIGSGLERVRRIVGDLRLLARPAVAHGEVADVRKAIGFALSLCALEIRHHARIVQDLEPVPLVAADEGQLGQVLINLLLNAAQSIPDGAVDANEVRISSRTDEAGWAIVEVKDTGAGMNEAVRKHVFDPFFTTKANGQGLGLGLSICHGLVTGFGGGIEVSSTVGVGTTFRVSLPPSRPLGRSIVPVATTGDRGGPPQGRFLIVDDETSITAAIVRLLGEGQCVACNSGREALDLIISGTRFDVILCDLMMPSVSGPEVHAALMAFAPDQVDRFVIMTGGPRTDRTRAFLDTVISPPLLKPFTREQLFATVHAVLERVGARATG